MADSNPTVGELFKAKAVTDDQVNAAVEAYLAAPRASAHPITDGYTPDLWGFETAKDAESYEAKGRALAGKFARVETELGGGPYFAGDRFSLVDATYAPIFRYFDVFDTITRTEVLDALPNIRRWRAALAERPSVREAVASDYADRLRTFLHDHDAWLLKRPR